MSNKRICMLSLAPMLFDARIQREARALRDAGYDVTNLYIEDAAYLAGVKNLEEAQASYSKDMKGIRTIPVMLFAKRLRWLPRPLFYMFVAIELVFRMVVRMVRIKADFYHAHDLEPAMFCWLGAKLHGGKLVYDAHENELTRVGKRLRGIMGRYERFVMNRSSLAITVNEDIQEKMQDRYDKPVEIIANRPFHVELEEIDKNRLRQSVMLKEEEKVLMYVGYVSPWVRGIEVVVEALKSLPKEVVLLIMGVGRLTEFKEHLDNFVKEKGLENVAPRIRFIGPFPPDDIVHYLHGANISMLLYQRNKTDNAINNAPNKFFQSVMARTPVLASDNQTFPEYIYRNRFGKIGETVDESEVIDVVERIESMLDKDQEELYRKNANLMAEEISWEAEATKLIKAYSLL